MALLQDLLAQARIARLSEKLPVRPLYISLNTTSFPQPNLLRPPRLLFLPFSIYNFSIDAERFWFRYPDSRAKPLQTISAMGH